MADPEARENLRRVRLGEISAMSKPKTYYAGGYPFDWRLMWAIFGMNLLFAILLVAAFKIL